MISKEECNRRARLRAKRFRLMYPERFAETQARWRKRNRSKIRQRDRLRYYSNLEASRERVRRYHAKNKHKAAVYRKQYQQQNRKRIAAHKRERQKRDENYRLSCCLRARIANALAGRRKLNPTFTLLGCSLESFWLYLESKFEPGMTRKNYGKVWEIDHIIPCALFDLTREDHQQRCFHVSNLQPMLVSDNRRKRATLPPVGNSV